MNDSGRKRPAFCNLSCVYHGGFVSRTSAALVVGLVIHKGTLSDVVCGVRCLVVWF
jgi:hypothetical protein